MRKARPDESIPQSLSEGTEPSRIIPIRTETTLAKYPVHRIAKKNKVKIKQTTRNREGRVETIWEVTNPPGPLGYKLDTIVINRRIDEMRDMGEIRQIVKLGSLRDICEELGITPTGPNISAIKAALRENAFAGITAKIEFTGSDGVERSFEFNTTRYTVIFTGEKLPDGKRADAVYIELHPRYHEMLKHSKTRPLDYEYLRQLPPSAQRLYELLSFTMFGTLKHGRPIAQMLYSEFCKASALTRYSESRKMHSQMWKIHKPHIDAGYIKSVEFKETIDQDGLIDWLMQYTPGPKARREYRHFNERARLGDSEARPIARPRLVGAKKASGEASAPARRPEDGALIEKLMSYDVDERSAAQLVESDRAESALWAEAWQYQNKKGMDNPAAVLVSFIRNKRRPLPKGYIEAARRKEREREETRRMAEDLHFQHFAPAYFSRLRDELAQIERARPDAYKAFREHFDERHAEDLRLFESEDLREEFTTRKAIEFFNELRPELGARLTTFEEWNRNENGENADPVEWFSRNPDVGAAPLAR